MITIEKVQRRMSRNSIMNNTSLKQAAEMYCQSLINGKLIYVFDKQLKHYQVYRIRLAIPMPYSFHALFDLLGFKTERFKVYLPYDNDYPSVEINRDILDFFFKYNYISKEVYDKAVNTMLIVL